MAILSIQSHVAYGHVGNTAAVFPLQRLGFEVWPVHTVLLSNHKGYATARGAVLGAGDVAEVLRGIAERGVFGRCRAVLSGYLGSAELGRVVVDTVKEVRAANPAAFYCCDPVMGDADVGFYVGEAVRDFLRREAVPAADLITPNQFELSFLTGMPEATLDDVLAAANAVRSMGPRTVLVTSLTRVGAAEDEIEMLALTGDGAYLVATPRLPAPVTAKGSGDLVAALFTAHLTAGTDAAAALERTAAAVFAVFEETWKSGSPELALVGAQDSLAAPPRRFPVRRVG